ncbi:hypothetical protein JCM8547_002820 [Rhodosporidiobolus lusitaniae]
MGRRTEFGQAFHNYTQPLTQVARPVREFVGRNPPAELKPLLERFDAWRTRVRVVLREEAEQNCWYKTGNASLQRLCAAQQAELARVIQEARAKRLSKEEIVRRASEHLGVATRSLTPGPATAQAVQEELAEEHSDEDDDLFFHPDARFAQQMALEPDDPNGYHGHFFRSLDKGDTHQITSRSALIHGYRSQREWQRQARRMWGA